MHLVASLSIVVRVTDHAVHVRVSPRLSIHLLLALAANSHMLALLTDGTVETGKWIGETATKHESGPASSSQTLLFDARFIYTPTLWYFRVQHGLRKIHTAGWHLY